MTRRMSVDFACDHCGARTESRYRDKWVQLAVGRAVDDHTAIGGDDMDACSADCAGQLAISAAARIIERAGVACTCGHSLGAHTAASPHECIADSACPCVRFRPLPR